MPDQHAAATEHDLIARIAEPLAALPDDPLALVGADFPVALRGYDRLAVDAYVERTTQLVAELQSTRSPEIAVRRALERVGEEISGILQRAHETADEVTARSRLEAEARLEAAREEARQLTEAAKREVRDLDLETERIWAERHSIVTDARELAQRLFELAEAAMERFPAEVSAQGQGKNAPVPAHPFDAVGDGGLEAQATPELAPEPLAEDESTVEHTAADERAQPTLSMPPVEPWEGEPAAEPWDGAEAPIHPDEV